ncbi:DUF4062 domain-containing protein [Streptomyces cavernae]|uniref:DUF4062 domain-containing protein n=1 Tax=Streptomyces cavernae TaxID=2259034 RepID=UPI000FEBC61A|nr:DUF4062 domain-containing protein [Streptomyces cavernae]
MFQANVVRVFIASPGDVLLARKAVREAIHHWNVVHSARRKVVMLPVGWETNAGPDSRADTQDVIDRQLLNDCDVLVGLFHTRIGRSTKDSVSGTVHEIDKFRDAGKRAAIYFCSKDVPQPQLSSARQVARFREQLQRKDRRLTGSFSTPASLKPRMDLLLNQVADEHQP